MSTEPKKLVLAGYLCAIGAAVLWGFHAVLIRILINQGIDPFMIGALRLFIGSTTLTVLVGIYSAIRRKRMPRVPYSPFFWVIAVSIGMNFLLFHKGLKFTIASDAMLLEALSPIMVLIIVMLFLPHHMKHLVKHPGMPQRVLQVVIIGSIGSALLLINDPKDMLITRSTKFTGDMIELMAMFMWALVMLGMHEYQKREPDHNSLAAASQFLFVAGLVMAPFVPWKELGVITPDQWFWIAILGVGSTAITYCLWHIASKYLDVFPLMTIFNFGSVFNVMTETAVLGLKLTWKLIVGGLLVIYAAVHAGVINAKYKVLEEKSQAPPAE